MCRFTKPDRSSPCVCDFVIDIDSEDLEEARIETLKVCDLLFKHLGEPPEQIDLFFSGAKGFHVIISIEVFGNLL